MANPIPKEWTTGTFGELLVQIRLLQFGVQAAPPLKDSGNDLVALKGQSVKTIQVKTATGTVPPWPTKEKLYNVLAVVQLCGEDRNIRLDDTNIFLVPKSDLGSLRRTWKALERYRLTADHIETIFGSKSS